MILPRVVEQVDIAPSIASILGFPFPCDGAVVEEVVDYAYGSERVFLVIIDSLGFEEYLENRDGFSFLSSMESRGPAFKCLSYSKLTTPSIASILCGLKPERHGIKRTEDAYLKKVKCLPEVAYEEGLRVAVVMEEYGALSFQGLVTLVSPVRDRPDIVKFDKESCYYAVKAIEEQDPNLLVVHFRSLDVLGFTSTSIRHVDQLLETLTKHVVGDTVFFVVGDHPPHYRIDEEHVALIVFKSEPSVVVRVSRKR